MFKRMLSNIIKILAKNKNIRDKHENEMREKLRIREKISGSG